ncbi:unnamed protein product [Rhizoctonia solani]|uniref:CHAT domain-containing protein n=1 Tax=Rhizoctonia solani TaxID=456999 RepID=A0A8H3H155_9AGAM|nr:unnamed protein product [Rhizoctonia solani]
MAWRSKLAENWYKLEEIQSAPENYQNAEVIVDLLVTQLAEEAACALENRKLSLGVLLQLVDILESQPHYTGRIRCIDLVIRCQSQAEVFVDDDSQRGGLISNLGTSYLNRFRLSRNQEDLSTSIAHHLKALQSVPQEHENTPIIMHSLGNSYCTQFRLTYNRNDIDKSIDFYTKAVNLTPQGHPYRAGQIASLGQSYCSRFIQYGELPDIEKAIELQKQGLKIATPNDPSIHGWLHNLGISYKSRFTRLCDLKDANEAIEHLTQSIGCMPKDYPNKPASLTLLGDVYQSRFDHGGNLADINLAIEYQTRAVLSTPGGDVQSFFRLGRLGSSYMSRFRWFGAEEDIKKAIELLAKALALKPSNLEDVDLLVSLGNTYGLRFEYLGQLSDVDEAINHLIQAETLASERHIAMSDILTSLGSMYFRRFIRLRRSEDIDKALEYQIRALGLQSQHYAGEGLILNNLGSIHTERFRHSKKQLDANNALECLTKSISFLSEDHPAMPGVLHSLADLYIARLQLDPTLEDIDTAINYQTQAVALTPEGHTQLPNFTNSLGLLYHHRYEKQGKLEDIDQAIHWQARSVMLTPNEHARAPIWLMALGDSFYIRSFNERDYVSFSSAIECYRKCAQHSTLSPEMQLEAAIKWATCISDSNVPVPEDWCLEAYQTAMDLVPHVVWLGTKIGKRYTDAQKIKDLASNAAAVAIRAAKYDLALEWLEEGRSVVWNQILKLRDPFDDLVAIDPLIAENLHQVAKELYNNGSTLEIHSDPLKDFGAQEKAIQNHHRLAENYQALVAAARKLPGLQDFLRPAKASTLAGVARSGPLVVINVSRFRCDALVIRPSTDQITHVALPELSLKTVNSARNAIVQSLRRNHVRDRGMRPRPKAEDENKDTFEDVLVMLWKCVAKPVLDALGYMPNTEELPRITWCATGALSFLPIHASGYYDRPDAKLSDYAVSSYTPTLSILLSAMSSSSELPHGILAVGQESTPRATPLPGTKKELENIKRYINEPLVYSQLEGHDATSHSVLSEMENHGWVHFACHAHQNAYNPIKSGFLLHKDTLYLEQIARVSFQNKGLAFLSACQTATGDQELPDESVHLASGMLMAGYSSVIATMWSIIDEDAPLIADEVYARVLEGGRMNTGGSARALHHAVCRLREKVGDKSFTRWVPYIHMGI